MDGRGPDTPGGGRKGRGVDIAVWCLVVAVIVALAAGIAAYLTGARFEIREVTFEDEVEEVTLIPPAAPPVARPPAPPAPAPKPGPTLGPNGEVLKPQTWVRQPRPDFPMLAMRRGVEEGAVVLLCETFATGEFGACQVVSETPPGAGFGEAALASTREARVTPYSIDGFETDGTIQFTVRFRLASEP